MHWPPHRLVPLALVTCLAAQELFAGRRRREEAQDRDKGSLTVLFIIIGFSYWVTFSLWMRQPPGPGLGDWSLWAGAALAVAGMTIRTWSVVTLGRYFTFEVKVEGDQPVVEAGPYRLVRHPSYTGAILTGVGIGLSLRYALAPLIIGVLQSVGYLLRIRVEEQALLGAIGPPYRAYMARTRRLIPFIF